MQEYTVRRGDTLSSIARAHGRPGWRDLYEAPENSGFRDLRPDPNRVYPGDLIYIPSSYHEGAIAVDESVDGFHGDEDEEHVEEEDEYERDPVTEPISEDDATNLHCVCRNLWNVIDSRPGGFFWFSA